MIEIKSRYTGATIISVDGADLTGANLYGVDLSRANLTGANLTGANLSRANLYGVDLSRTDLSRAKNAKLIIAQTVIVPQGTLVVWKKAKTRGGQFSIVKLSIPDTARRSNATTRKCRFEFADVLDDGGETCYSLYDAKTPYTTGQRVTCDSWDNNRWNECSGGIHAFLTRDEAEAYNG